MPSYVLSVLGDDRSGLVEALSEVVARHGGNWERSHMTQLAGKFAGVLLVTVPPAGRSGFLADLEPLETRGLLDISVEEAGAAAVPTGTRVLVEVVGNDHPGIVHEVSHLLAGHRVSIGDLQTWTSPAPMAGGTLFHATATVTLPEGLSGEQLTGELEALAADLMVDITLVTD
jgi:glycine cleavage system regulatory protein